MTDDSGTEAKFTKSATGRRTESSGLALLLSDPRFQAPGPKTRRRIIDLLPVQGAWGIQTFDAIMTDEPSAPISTQNIEDRIDDIYCVEMKTTRKPIKNRALNGFFFGATEREYAMAQALGPRYVFAFIVLNDQNDYGHPFFVLLSLEQLEARTRVKRVQYQVYLQVANTFAKDMLAETLAEVPREPLARLSMYLELLPPEN